MIMISYNPYENVTVNRRYGLNRMNILFYEKFHEFWNETSRAGSNPRGRGSFI